MLDLLVRLAASPIVSWTATLLLVGLFGFAAWHKLSGLAEFRGALAAYRLLPRWAIDPAAGLLIVVEAGVALALLLRIDGGQVAALLVLACYSGAMLINLLRGRRFIDCGCGGPGQPLSYGLLVRNLLLIGLCLLAAPVPDVLGAAGVFTVAVAGLSGALLYAAVNHLLMLRALLDEPEL